MFLSIKINNCLIYNREVEFSMIADMRYKRFSSNVVTIKNVHALKSAILIGPNNSGKTNLIKIISLFKKIMLNQNAEIKNNMFSENPIVELCLSFLENGKQYLFEIKYDTNINEYIYERFALVQRIKQYSKENVYYLRDSKNGIFEAKDKNLELFLKLAAKNNILI